jgi:hypothetical protein
VFLCFIVCVFANAHLELALLRTQNHRLPIHATHHVEGFHGFSLQRDLKHVLLDLALHDLADLVRNLEVAIRWAQAPDALLGATVVVILDPHRDALLRVIEAVEVRFL